MTLVKIEDICDVINNHWPAYVAMRNMPNAWDLHMDYKFNPQVNSKQGTYEPINPGELVSLDAFVNELIYGSETYKIAPTFRALFMMHKPDYFAFYCSLNNTHKITGALYVDNAFTAPEHVDVTVQIKPEYAELLTKIAEVFK